MYILLVQNVKMYKQLLIHMIRWIKVFYVWPFLYCVAKHPRAHADTKKNKSGKTYKSSELNRIRKPHLSVDLPCVLFTSSSPWHSNKGIEGKGLTVANLSAR